MKRRCWCVSLKGQQREKGTREHSQPQLTRTTLMATSLCRTVDGASGVYPPLKTCLSENRFPDHSSDTHGGTSQILLSGHFRNDRSENLDLGTLPPQLKKKKSFLFRDAFVYCRERAKASLQAKEGIRRETGREEGLALVSGHSLLTVISLGGRGAQHMLPHRSHKVSEYLLVSVGWFCLSQNVWVCFLQSSGLSSSCLPTNSSSMPELPGKEPRPWRIVSLEHNPGN